MKHARLVWAIALLGLVGFLAVGCSNVESIDLPDATLEGNITYQGKPVPFALVIVTDGKYSQQGFADAQGHYKIEHCPIGEVKIGVNTEAAVGQAISAQMAAAQKGEKPPQVVQIPQKYFEPDTSGITTTTSKGANTFDIVIE